MNLIHDPWIPVIRQDGSRCRIAPWQIAETDNPVVELDCPRPDFQGGMYQFLIGLLQSCCTPEDEYVWHEWYEEPINVALLKEKLSVYDPAMILNSGVGTPAFMQDKFLDIDFDNVIPVTSLFIENSSTHFNHPIDSPVFCESCTAQALYVLQQNAPPGGQGHMMSLRGNGPLTTIVRKESDNTTLWQNLWLNVVLNEEIGANNLNVCDPLVFPWLYKTKTSESCTTKQCPDGCERCATFPDPGNLLQQYWGMPKRIRVTWSEGDFICSCCGDKCESVGSGVYIKNKGIRYAGGWKGTLTPYVFDVENIKLPSAVTGRIGRSAYKNWLGLVVDGSAINIRRSDNLKSFYYYKQALLEDAGDFSVWAFGFDVVAGQAKARCWYDHRLPVHLLSDDQLTSLRTWAGILIDPAVEGLELLAFAIKDAWFREIKGAKKDAKKAKNSREVIAGSINPEFWQKTEGLFYQLLARLAEAARLQQPMPAEIKTEWFKALYRTLAELFDQYALSSCAEDMDLNRVLNARATLFSKFNSLKAVKALKTDNKQTTEVANG
jgi:CRISPR system Cascade subunit CasA